MESSRFIDICFLVFCASLVIPTRSHSYSHAALFIFGDSLYDVGNNNYLKNALARVNIKPYGQTFFKYPTGRASDGRLIPDFIAEFAKLPLIPPYLQPGNRQFINGVNFASGGAGALVETNQRRVIDLKTQLRNFKNIEKQLREKVGVAEVKTLLSKAVYIFSIGSNDYYVPFATNSTVLQSYSQEEVVKMVIGNITTVIQEIYKIGGRKFGLSKLTPLGCDPALRALKLATTGGSGCMDEANMQAKLHNIALPEVLKELESNLKGFKYSIFDCYTTTDERLNKPSKYGFKEVKMACCGSGPYRGSFTCGLKGYQLCDNVSEYLYFDAVHPTEKANYQFAKLMWKGSTEVVKPYNLKTLFEM
ncbi:PREDICTED: GDSL esterase/lipase 1-like [Populus euphratica]|uniref:GDSL esterase/lipase 1-like n=1 Tax=Populus euphratica TaxID=75702 RepID=A0AAJ6V9S4_POPEU|nr:PREDICTED: GDSL esterase/lipase 1-like [Populus euphratica]